MALILVCTTALWAVDDAADMAEIIDSPAQARAFVVAQAPGMSEQTYANLVRYAFDSGLGGVSTEDLTRAIHAAQWQVYQRLQEKAQKQLMAEAELAVQELD